MAYIVFTEGGSPHLNVALEEALLEYAKTLGEPIARIWLNPPSVVIGYTLGPCEEVDCTEAMRLGVPVVRRISAGGAVYHDEGNVNVSLYIPRKMGVMEAYRLITGVVSRLLEGLGLKPSVENVNDVAVHGWKVSGSAAAIRVGATLVHATLLVSTDPWLVKRLTKARLDRVLSGEVNMVKYNPNSLERILGSRIGVYDVVEGLAREVENVLGSVEPIDPGIWGEALFRADGLCRDKYASTKRWSPLGKGRCTPPDRRAQTGGLLS